MTIKTEDLSATESVAFLLLFVIALPVHIVSDVYVLRRLWEMAVEPTFHIATPSALTMFLLNLFVMQLRWKPRAPNGYEPTARDAVKQLVGSMAAPWLIFFSAKVGIWLMS